MFAISDSNGAVDYVVYVAGLKKILLITLRGVMESNTCLAMSVTFYVLLTCTDDHEAVATYAFVYHGSISYISQGMYQLGYQTLT